MKEQEVRKKVKALIELYMDIISFAFVNTVLTIVWLAFDRSGIFWPKYVIIVWGIALTFKAYRLDVIRLFLHHISFLTPEWEDKKVNELIGQRHVQRKILLNRNMKKK